MRVGRAGAVAVGFHSAACCGASREARSARLALATASSSAGEGSRRASTSAGSASSDCGGGGGGGGCASVAAAITRVEGAWRPVRGREGRGRERARCRQVVRGHRRRAVMHQLELANCRRGSRPPSRGRSMFVRTGRLTRLRHAATSSQQRRSGPARARRLSSHTAAYPTVCDRALCTGGRTGVTPRLAQRVGA
jgi:hypothetical protein